MLALEFPRTYTRDGRHCPARGRRPLLARVAAGACTCLVPTPFQSPIIHSRCREVGQCRDLGGYCSLRPRRRPDQGDSFALFMRREAAVGWRRATGLVALLAAA